MTGRKKAPGVGRPVWVVAILAVAVMAWLAARNDDWRRAFDLTHPQGDYYNLLVHGVRKGHLAMDVAVDPRLLSGDPAVRAQVPDLIDASLFRGKYYLYFGAVPAVVLFLPYSLLTGHDLPENAATLLFVAGGFLCYLCVYLGARQRTFSQAPAWTAPVAVLLLAFGSATPLLLTASRVYEVAVAGGYCCMAGAWLAMARALPGGRNAGRWLAAASLALGLAVGCRPNYVFALPLLLATAVLIGRSRRQDGPGGGRSGWPALAAAAVVPAAIIGLGLAAYNYGRFGNPLEFGFTYQLTGRSAKLASPLFLWSNLEWYYLRPPNLSPYFPYVFPLHPGTRPADYYGQEEIYGQWPIFDLALLTAAWCLSFGRRAALPTPGFRILCALIVAGFACLLLSVGFFSFQVDRYMPDFQGSLVLAVALLGSNCSAREPKRRGRWIWGAGYGILAGAGALYSVLASLQLGGHFAHDRPGSYQRLAYLGNYPSSLLGERGPVSFKVIFPRLAGPGPRQSLLSTGLPGQTDVLSVEQLSDHRVELTLQHGQETYRSLTSGPLTIEPGREYEIRADLGSLYPPGDHPFFRHWPARDVQQLKTTAQVWFDGRKVIEGHLPFYDSPPDRVYFGRDPAGATPAFSGSIRSLRRLPPLDPASFGSTGQPGTWRFQIQISSLFPGYGYPLLASGVAGHGNLLLLQSVAAGTVRFGFDQWGSGYQQSPPFHLSSAGSHRLEVFLGPWSGRPGLAPAAGPVRVWWDGQAVWTAAMTANLDTSDWIAVGSNPQGFSNAERFFVGGIRSMPYSVGEMPEFIARNLPPADNK